MARSGKQSAATTAAGDQPAGEAASPGPSRWPRAWRQLGDAYERAVASSSAAVASVTGEGGIGKTSLLKTFAADLARPDRDPRPRVAYGAARRSGDGYASIRWALRSLLEDARRRDQRGARRLAELMWTVAPEWLGAVPGVGGLLKAVALTVDTIKRPAAGAPVEPLADQLFDLVRELAQDRPLVLLLDDLHWAGDATAGLLFDLVRACADDEVPLLVVAAARPQGDTHPVGRALRDLGRYVPAAAVRLNRLDQDGVAEVTRAVMGRRPPDVLARWLRRRTGGNPLFLEQWLAFIAEQGFPAPATWADGALDEAIAAFEHRWRAAGAALPTTVEAVLAAHLDDLTEPERRLLEVATVLGETLHAADLAGLVDEPEAATAATLRLLCQRRGLLLSAPAEGDDAYRFVHDQLVDLLAGRLAADRHDATRLHLRRAAQLEAAIAATPIAHEGDGLAALGEAGTVAFDRLEALARHYMEAGRLDLMLATARRACHAASSAGSLRDRALRLAEQARSWVEDAPGRPPGLRAVAEVIVAEALVCLQRFVPALAAARRAEALAEPTDGGFARACALLLRAGIETRDNPDYARRDLVTEAISLLVPLHAGHAERDRHAAGRPARHDAWAWPGGAPSREQVQAAAVREKLLEACNTAGWLAMRVGDWTTALAALDEGERINAAMAPPHPLWAARFAQVRGECLAQQGRWAEAVAPLQDARRRFADVGDRLGVCAALGWAGLARCHAGHLDAGLADVRAALRFERDHLRSMEGVSKWLHLVGELFLARGEPAEAVGPLWLAGSLRDELGHVEAARTAAALAAARDALGDGAYRRLRGAFDPGESPWGEYAFLWQLAPFVKHPGNPILVAGGNDWESLAVFNPAAWPGRDGAVNLVYRAVGPTAAGGEASALGLAVSADGVTFERRAPDPVLAPTEPWELPGGCEDPRTVPVGDRLLGTYTAYDGHVARIACFVASTDDPASGPWRKTGLALDDDDWDAWFTTAFPPGSAPDTPRGWSKSAALIPEPIDGRWRMFFGDTHIWAAWTDRDPEAGGWTVVRRPVLSPRPGRFDARLVEPGPPPLLRDDGLLLIYNAADEQLRYAAGQALLSRRHPTRVLRRSPEPFLTVTDPLERDGRVPNVVFASGLVRHGDTWRLYYGMGDAAVGLAVCPATPADRA